MTQHIAAENFDRAFALHQADNLVAAEAAYREGLALCPGIALLHSNLGLVLYQQGRLEESIAAQRRAIALDPGLAMAHNNLGLALNALGDYAAAMSAFRRSIELDSTDAHAFNNLGDSFVKLSRFEEAATLFGHALTITPQYVEAHVNLGTAYWGLNRLDDAVACFRKAIELEPGNAMAHKNLGLVWLQAGHYENGWRECEWRWRADRMPVPTHHTPLWQGEQRRGRLFVLPEHGVGDQILHAGMIADLVARGFNVVWETDPRLVWLLRRSSPGVRIVGAGNGLKEICVESDDAHIPAMSLGRYLRPSAATIPTRQPYLTADVDRIRLMRRELLRPGEKLVGLSWRSLHPDYGQSKSIELLAFAGMLRTPGVRFVDLQYGCVRGMKHDVYAERAAVKRQAGIEIEHVEGLDLSNDLDGAAALASACDLVITVSNTIAHLAAALGRPTWVMLPAGVGKFWYWGLAETTPWYPTARLFRQFAPGYWLPTLWGISVELAKFAAVS